MNHKLLNKQLIAQAYSAAASTYDQAAFVEQQIGTNLLERLAAMQLQPQRILDLGCGTGYLSQQLHQMYPAANIIGIDWAMGMVKFARDVRGNIPKIQYYCADAANLPFAKRCFHLIVANCCFMPNSDLMPIFTELHRVLTTKGLLVFTTFGPDTLQEFALNSDWLDMHHIGDLLLAAKFANPVVEMEHLKVNYNSLVDLLQDLSESGSYQIDKDEIENWQQSANLSQACSANFEVISGSAWGAPLLQRQTKDIHGQVLIDIDSIQRL